MKCICFILVTITILVVGCSQSYIPESTANITQSPTLTATATNTPTVTISPTPTLTNTPEPSNTATPIPENLKEELAQTYTAMVLIQANTNLLFEVADRIHKGEINGFDTLGYILGIAGFIGGINEVIPEIDPGPELNAYWEESIEIHQATKELLGQWIDEEIDSAIVLDEIEMPMERIDKIMKTVEVLLGNTYGFDSSELTTIREEIIDSMDEIFATPTP